MRLVYKFSSVSSSLSRKFETFSSLQATSQTTHLGHQAGHFGQPGGGCGGDPRVHVVWARFEIADVNDPKLFPEGAEVNGNSPPLLLVLGYTQGVQARTDATLNSSVVGEKIVRKSRSHNAVSASEECNYCCSNGVKFPCGNSLKMGDELNPTEFNSGVDADVAAADERRGAGGAELATGNHQDAEDLAGAGAQLLQWVARRIARGQLRALQATHRPRRLRRARGRVQLRELHLAQKRRTGERRLILI